MKVIDLLNKIANGEIKDKTIFRINWGHLYRDFYYDSSEQNQLQCLKNCSDHYSIYDDIKLNEEVEIIEDTSKDPIFTLRGTPHSIRKSLGLTPKEEKKIEKIQLSDIYGIDYNDAKYTFAEKINKIIDCINEKC